MCIQNFEDITLYGNGYTGEHVNLAIRLVRCHNKTSCKNETEINDFLDKNGQLVYYFNGVNYQTEIYSEQVIQKFIDSYSWAVKSTDNSARIHWLRNNFLESEERYLGDGFFPREAEWVEVIEIEELNDGWDL